MTKIEQPKSVKIPVNEAEIKNLDTLLGMLITQEKPNVQAIEVAVDLRRSMLSKYRSSLQSAKPQEEPSKK